MDKVTLFGSYTRGEAGEDSDVDLVVEASRPLGFARGAICLELEQALGCSVDVIYGEKNLYPFVRDAVSSEGMVLYETRAPHSRERQHVHHSRGHSQCRDDLGRIEENHIDKDLYARSTDCQDLLTMPMLRI